MVARARVAGHSVVFTGRNDSLIANIQESTGAHGLNADVSVDADNARDLDRVLGYYAADALLMPPGEGPVGGLAAIRPRYVSLFEAFTPQIACRSTRSAPATGSPPLRACPASGISANSGYPRGGYELVSM